MKLTSLALLFLAPVVGAAAADPRNFKHGRLIPDEGYCDQPYIVITGYTRFGDAGAPLTGKEIGDVSGGATLRVGSGITHLRVYTRYLTTSEAVGNYRAGP